MDQIFHAGHEQVAFCHDPEAGYRAIIAIHSTVLGPAVGGTRFRHYASIDDALTDALRLSRGMTYKNAVAGLAMGGGKAVIIGDPATADRARLFAAHGRFVERFGGRFITGEDVGTSPSDMEFAARESSHVAGIDGRGGDPSPWTARGVFRGIQACAAHRWGSPELAARRVAIQGCGNVGAALAGLLANAGATLVVADADATKAERMRQSFGATVVDPLAIHEVESDIFAPCALGGILNDETIPRLGAEVVAGAANNQLLEERHGAALEARGILYAPDFVINAGGVISGSVAILGETPARMAAQVDAIYDTLQRVVERAAADGLTTARAARQIAEERLQQGRSAFTGRTTQADAARASAGAGQ